nr:ATP-binding cassette domain-containing protein [Acholeplasma laidlawii]
MSVALVGHTGSGKTTIVNLISRFYEPTQGQILLDGVDYKDRSISWLHEKLGYVLQSPHLFSTTILENIRYGRLDATDEEVIEASKAIGLHPFVEKLENGYQTHVGEGGGLLSMGQKQLISFARAILAEPSILILDEATSSIDSEAESLIQDATKKLLNGRTSLIVAHRLSTIVDSDLIVMLDQGKITEQGTHHELLLKQGAYYDLYRNQFLEEKSKVYEAEMNKL